MFAESISCQLCVTIILQNEGFGACEQRLGSSRIHALQYTVAHKLSSFVVIAMHSESAGLHSEESLLMYALHLLFSKPWSESHISVFFSFSALRNSFRSSLALRHS